MSQRIIVSNTADQSISVGNVSTQNIGVGNNYGIGYVNDETLFVYRGLEYFGSYSINPNTEGVTLLTAGRVLEENVVINPIPSNYGLVTYNGFELTIS